MRRVSLDDLPPAERLPYWREVVCRDTYGITPSDWSDPATFQASIDIRDRGRFGLAEVDSVERSRERSRADIARDGADHVVLYRAGRRSIVCDHGAAPQMLEPGDICLLSVARGFTLRAETGVAFRSLIIPRAVLSPMVTGGRVHAARFLEAGSPLGTVLGGALDTAWAEVPRLTPDLGDGILETVSRLVALAYAPSLAEEDEAGDSSRAARLMAVRRYVTIHAVEPNLSPSGVARAFGISVRQLHLLFEGEAQSFARFVARCRLQACHAALQSPASAGRSVADIAFGHGFNSLATFYRVFEATYGLAPGQVRPWAGKTPPAK